MIGSDCRGDKLRAAQQYARALLAGGLTARTLRLILLGEAMHGKTSLLRALRNRDLTATDWRTIHMARHRLARQLVELDVW